MLKKVLQSIILLALFTSLIFPLQSAYAAEPIELHTPYTGISVTPGESITYTFDVINNSSSIQHINIELQGIKEGWDYSLTAGGWDLHELSVKPGDTDTISVNLRVPLQIEKGTYKFKAVAESTTGIKRELPMEVVVTEKGTFKTEWTSEQTNLTGHADSSFEYSAKLTNRTGSEQTYALIAGAPRGWGVDFKVSGKSVTSVTVDSNKNQDVTIVVTPPAQAEADTYQIPIRATNDSTSGDIVLEAAITGSFGLELTTPSGKLSENITAGKDTKVELVVKNTGTTPINDVNLNANKPEGWDVEFEPAKINALEPGKTATVHAKITANSKAVAGDYVVEMTASAPEATADAQFRMSVKTSLVWGWVGVLVILAVIGGIFYLIRKYGRR